MVYRVKGVLSFPTTAARDAAVAAVAGSTALAIEGRASMRLVATHAGPIQAQTQYTSLVTAGNTNGAMAGSTASWHACYHGELIQKCVTTGSKVW
jgi:hypothetical protein